MAAGEPVSQAAVDTLVINFICDKALPFSVVEDESFKQLVTILKPQIKVISKATVTTRIHKAAEDMKKNLIAELGKVKFIATTADCWLANEKQYLGVTCHWIDEESLERKSVALACKRLRGSQTFDKLGRALYEVHCQYQIEDKVVRTTTDNGSNFIKAFKAFGAQNVAQIDEDEAQADADSSDYESMLAHAVRLLEIGNDEDEEDQDADSSDDEDSGLSIRLPPHQRCVCHLLNLVVTKDAAPEKLQDSPSKELFRAALAKCKAIWNKAGRSHLASEVAEDIYQLKIISPKATKWNSTYLAFERLIRLIDEKGEKNFEDMCRQFEVEMLSPVEVAFLRDFCATVKPLEIALKKLQSGSKIWLGSLLPEIYKLQSKMTRMETSSKFCKPLIRALQEGLTKRFKQMMKDPELAAAAILLPKFKTTWTDSNVIDAGLEYLRQHVKETDLTCYLDGEGSGIEVLHSFPTIKELFLRLNTALPASAACERLFSAASQVFTSRRSQATSENLENQLLLKVNKAFRE